MIYKNEANEYALVKDRAVLTLGTSDMRVVVYEVLDENSREVRVLPEAAFSALFTSTVELPGLAGVDLYHIAHEYVGRHTAAAIAARICADIHNARGGTNHDND